MADYSTEYTVVPPSHLTPWPHNPRKTFDTGAIAELSESIARVGILQPLVVRRIDAEPVQEARYEIIAGERRWRAAMQAGISQVPVRIVDVVDGDALEMALTENGQRQDVDPYEEAVAVARLVRHHHRAVDQVAERLGHPARWVRSRLRLADAPAELVTLLREGRVPIGGAQAILACAPDIATDVIRRVQETAADHRWTTAQILDLLDRRTQRLVSAPWDLSDGSFAGGPCAGCPRRSGAQIDMWSGPGEDRCLDAGCWDARKETWWGRRQDEVAAAGGRVAKTDGPWAGADGLVKLDRPLQWHELEKLGLDTDSKPTWREVLEERGVNVAALQPSSIVAAVYGGGWEHQAAVAVDQVADALAAAGAGELAGAVRGPDTEGVVQQVAAERAQRKAERAVQIKDQKRRRAAVLEAWAAADDLTRLGLVRDRLEYGWRKKHEAPEDTEDACAGIGEYLASEYHLRDLELVLGTAAAEPPVVGDDGDLECGECGEVLEAGAACPGCGAYGSAAAERTAAPDGDEEGRGSLVIRLIRWSIDTGGTVDFDLETATIEQLRGAVAEVEALGEGGAA